LNIDALSPTFFAAIRTIKEAFGNVSRTLTGSAYSFKLAKSYSESKYAFLKKLFN
jgi:hypothetical protein